MSYLFVQRFAREVLVWKRLSHPNVLPFLGVWTTHQFKFAMVSVWMPHGNVVDYVQKHPKTNRLTLVSSLAPHRLSL
jgi:serine/threonine protein kinase